MANVTQIDIGWSFDFSKDAVDPAKFEISTNVKPWKKPRFPMPEAIRLAQIVTTVSI